MESVKKTIEAAMSYDMTDVMARYAEKTRLPPDVLKEHEREIKRFLALSAANPGKYGMRGPLDELWHTFIIFTSSYARFCQRLGGGFIHHRPEPPKKARVPASTKRNSYTNFLEDYRKVFNEAPPAHLWPGRPGGEVLDPSCDQCGIFCAQTCAAIVFDTESKRF
jgi:hypothetical protein